MPTYDYACSGCGHRFERFEPIGDGGLKECPKCHKKKAKRMLGAGAGLIFKGSGFYTTDSRRPSSGGEKDSGSGSKEAEKKPAAKDSKETKEKKEEPKK
jgi:putative FmdB family regulatory protein